jgi:hypothetical protein
MSKIIQPFGTLKREIVIKADDKGMIVVDAYNYETVVTRGFRPTTAKVPMDVREMVLALIKVVQDYSTVLFATMGEGIIKNNGKQQENKNNDHQGQP